MASQIGKITITKDGKKTKIEVKCEKGKIYGCKVDAGWEFTKTSKLEGNTTIINNGVQKKVFCPTGRQFITFVETHFGQMTGVTGADFTIRN